MTSRRIVVLGGPLLCMLAGLVLLVATAVAAPPTNCSGLTTFQAVANQKVWDAPLHNNLLCVINILITRSLIGGYYESRCQSVTLTANERKLVAFGGFSAGLTSTDPAIQTVTDPTNPSRVEPSGIQSVGGSTVNAYFWNRDIANTRVVNACVQVRRS